MGSPSLVGAGRGRARKSESTECKGPILALWQSHGNADGPARGFYRDWSHLNGDFEHKVRSSGAGVPDGAVIAEKSCYCRRKRERANAR